MSHPTNPLDDPAAQRFINDPRTLPCDRRRDHTDRQSPGYWASPNACDGVMDPPSCEDPDEQ